MGRIDNNISMLEAAEPKGLLSFYSKVATKIACFGKLLYIVTVAAFILNFLLFEKLNAKVLMVLTLAMLWTGGLAQIYYFFSESSKLELKNGEFKKLSPFEKATPGERKYFAFLITLYFLFLFTFTLVDFIFFVRKLLIF